MTEARIPNEIIFMGRDDARGESVFSFGNGFQFDVPSCVSVKLDGASPLTLVPSAVPEHNASIGMNTKLPLAVIDDNGTKKLSVTPTAAPVEEVTEGDIAASVEAESPTVTEYNALVADYNTLKAAYIELVGLLQTAGFVGIPVTP
jgi:hypothetical protein